MRGRGSPEGWGPFAAVWAPCLSASAIPGAAAGAAPPDDAAESLEPPAEQPARPSVAATATAARHRCVTRMRPPFPISQTGGVTLHDHARVPADCDVNGHDSATEGHVRVTKNTHACIRFEGSAAGGVLVVDPGTFGERDALDGADAVLITHEHADHL